MPRLSLRAHGFTLVELLVVMALGAILLSATYFISLQTLRTREFERARETVHRELWHARADTLANTQDSNWGVNVSPHALTRYRGNSYASRQIADDVVHTFSDNVTLSSNGDIVFQRPEGTLSSARTITITDELRTTTTTISISGVIISP